MNLEAATGPQQARESAGSPLTALQRLAAAAGAESLARDVAALAERVAESRFYVAVLGQFKRGKSTLVNALVGASILPTGVTPVTAVVTVVRFGRRPVARVRLADGRWREVPVATLHAYLSQADNPGNEKAVAGVEVLVPSALLASGLCLVDTPGVGSVFTAGTEATRAFVPHIDAGLVVLGADPPVSELELELIADVARHCRDLVLVLNKADRVPPGDLEDARTFTARVVTERLGRETGAILDVSATEAIADSAGTRRWGMLEERLGELARDSGGALVDAAEARGRAALVARLRRDLQEREDALLRPLAASEARVAELRRFAADAEGALRELSYRLSAEQDRLRTALAARSAAFLERTLPGARQTLVARIAPLDRRGPRLRAAGVLIAREIARSGLDAWRQQEEPAVEALYTEATRSFVALANAFLRRLADDGDPALAGLPHALAQEAGFRFRSRLAYNELRGEGSGGSLAPILDVFRSRRAILDHTLVPHLDHLLGANVTRIENDFDERIRESRRRLEYELRETLRGLHATAEQALERARGVRGAGERAVESEVQRLERFRREAEALAPRDRHHDDEDRRAV